MKIEKNISLNNIEEYFDKALEISNKLELSKEYSNKNFFDVTSSLQVIITFIRNNDNYILTLPLKKIKISNELDEDFMSELQCFREETNYTATILSWAKKKENFEFESLEKSYLNNFTPIIKREMNTQADQFKRSQKGNSLFLTCFDHFVDAKGLLDSFYLDNTNFYDQKEFFFSPFNERLSFFSKSFNKTIATENLQIIFDDITNIIYELMLNTHEWARTDENFKELNPNVRGIYIKHHKGKIENFRKKYHDNNSMSEYLENSFSKDNQGLTTFFEISVFDSGPGFVRRNNTEDRDLTIEEEIDIIKKCMTLHQTSASGHQSIVKGAGLDRISRILSEKRGFFKIRTERSSLFRNYIKNPYNSVENYKDIKFSDWKSPGLDDFFSTNTKVEGTTINILYPFVY
ncbi:hypothetical protein [uncultured Chryseobacterium sp.]|uniref:hypothetical protein n=1 Tax=uncultured Chryseobacterium sp. TaxID=259322 RepID=UPI0025CCA9D5|nr:hypothetical protein [uncultured Chryseobacterium sp.]